MQALQLQFQDIEMQSGLSAVIFAAPRILQGIWDASRGSADDPKTLPPRVFTNQPMNRRAPASPASPFYLSPFYHLSILT